MLEPLVEPVEPVEPVEALVPDVPLVIPESDWKGRPFDCEFASKLESRNGRPCGGFWLSNARPFGVELLDPTELPWPEPTPPGEALFVLEVPESAPELELVELLLAPLLCPDCEPLLEPLAPCSEEEPLCCELLW